MKFTTALLIGSASAIHLRQAPDVYGPNGDNYANNNPSQDVAMIGISRTTQGSGPQCTTGDWAVVHWKGYLTDGRLITDSRAEGLGYPKTFSVGKNEVFKCWELALPQLKKGDKASVSCPAGFVWGGAYVMSPLGGEPIPLHSDVNFELEVLDCARNPESFERFSYKQPHTTTLQPGKCFYLHHKTGADLNINRVLTSQDGALTVEHKVVDEPTQQWYVNPLDGTIYNAANPDKVIDFSDAKNLKLALPGSSANQRGYDYTFDDQVVAPNALVLSYDNVDKKVKFDGNLRNNNQFWHVEYCYNFVPTQNLDQGDNDVNIDGI
jgi:hypothetical protein